MNEQEREQNKRINQHKRLITNLRERLKTVELDVEPNGRISEAFDRIEQHLERQDERFDQHDKRFDRLEHKVNQLSSKLDIVIEHLTKINDLPEE